MKVIKKQSNSKMCLICGLENPLGLQAAFYEMADQTVVSRFTYREHHQSYPGRAHGGMITCMLDEIIGRAIWLEEPETWGVTTSITVKFRKPVPYDTSLKAMGKIVKNTTRMFQGIGEIRDVEGNILATAEATYFKLPVEKIAAAGYHDTIQIMVPDQITEI